MEKANLNFYDTDWKKVGYLDVYTSLIWTRRFTTYGDFELYVPYKPLYAEFIKPDYYVEIENDPTFPKVPGEIDAMIIEHIEIIQEPEQPTMMLIKGRSLESIMYRRVFYNDVVLTRSNPAIGYDLSCKEAYIEYIIKNCFGKTIRELNVDPQQRNGFVEPRAITYDIFNVNIATPSADDSRVRTIVKNDNLGESLDQYLSSWGYGIEMLYVESVEGYYIRLYESQDKTDSVIFRADLDNLANCHYIHDTTGFANVARISSGDNTMTYPSGADSSRYEKRGLLRYETAFDTDLLGTPETTGKDKALQASAQRQIREFENVEDITADIINDKTFVYGNDKDYSLGDKVKVVTDFGYSASVQIKEITQSWSVEGYTKYPTFGTFKIMEEIDP